MEDRVRSWQLVEHLLDASVSPERVDELITLWDAQMERAGMSQPRLAEFAGPAFAHQIAGVLQILEQLQAAELRRANDLLSAMLGAAMVLAGDGTVVASNDGAARLFGLCPGGSVRRMALDAADMDILTTRLAQIAAGTPADDILRLCPAGFDHAVLVHLKAMPHTGSRRHVLAVTSEFAWPPGVSDLLARVFRLTGAETEVMRRLAGGGTVAGIAAATGRGAGTVRSQLHAVLQKTGARSQAELMRLAMVLAQSVPAGAEPPRPLAAPAPHQRFHRMPDGRRLEVLSFGDPAGRPVIWMQSNYGLWRLPRAAEADMARRRLRVMVPFRAGYCGSDPVPPGSHPFDIAVADLRALMRQLRLRSAVVVAPGHDIRIALMLARAAPDLVRAVFAIGAGFPILNDTQYRRLIPIARFTRTCARYSPRVLPFLIRSMRVVISTYGLERYLRGILARIPADARAMADPEVAAAFRDGVDKTFFAEPWSETAFCTELPLFHEDWPGDLGHVACPVTLIHGEQDGNAPFETALEYCALYPGWRCVAWPDEGELVAHVQWRAVLDLIGQAWAPETPLSII
ncbi:LuxR C-terminal-related transcriptional regulator [Paracoccus shandongensis]|uniref:LuxR C-terminal-related transcriptional regulator n=1 Tax=Paracoccus shandongensis TaxID=2816048 RepID=UPI001A8D0D6D|nr:LuxR C-terminal-related transcriptional regulator [Paracoccus shandongensis]